MSEILCAFLKNEKAIRRYLSRFSSTGQDVDDFTQETFLRAFAAEIRQDIKEPKAFLFKVAKNIALADIRKRKTQGSIYFPVDSGRAELILDESQMSADEYLDGRRKLASFVRAVAALPPKCRKAFLLRRIDGLQYKQIANRMNISVSAVEKHVASGLLKVNAYLREQGYVPSEFGRGLHKLKEKSEPRDSVILAVKQDEKN